MQRLADPVYKIVVVVAALASVVAVRTRAAVVQDTDVVVLGDHVAVYVLGVVGSLVKVEAVGVHYSRQ